MGLHLTVCLIAESSWKRVQHRERTEVNETLSVLMWTKGVSVVVEPGLLRGPRRNAGRSQAMISSITIFMRAANATSDGVDLFIPQALYLADKADRPPSARLDFGSRRRTTPLKSVPSPVLSSEGGGVDVRVIPYTQSRRD